MRFKIGDRVLIKDCLNWIVGTDASMYKYEDKIATITSIVILDAYSHLPFERCYTIDLDNGVHYWTDGMIRKKVEENKMGFNYKIGDTVIISRNLNTSMRNVIDGMLVFKGEVAKVIRITEDGDRKYYLDIDDGNYFWLEEMLEDTSKGVTFQRAVATIQDGQTFVSEDGTKTISLENGILTLEGIDETVYLNEIFKQVRYLTLQEVLVGENHNCTYKMILEDKEHYLVKVKDTGANDIYLVNLEDDETDINDSVYLSKILEAKFVEIELIDED